MSGSSDLMSVCEEHSTDYGFYIRRLKLFTTHLHYHHNFVNCVILSPLHTWSQDLHLCGMKAEACTTRQIIRRNWITWKRLCYNKKFAWKGNLFIQPLQGLQLSSHSFSVGCTHGHLYLSPSDLFSKQLMNKLRIL